LENRQALQLDQVLSPKESAKLFGLKYRYCIEATKRKKKERKKEITIKRKKERKK
jgi:hypothetical protein